MWGWVKNIVQPLLPKQEEFLPVEQNPRLNSYLDYRINEGILSYIEVDNTRLYF